MAKTTKKTAATVKPSVIIWNHIHGAQLAQNKVTTEHTAAAQAMADNGIDLATWCERARQEVPALKDWPQLEDGKGFAGLTHKLTRAWEHGDAINRLQTFLYNRTVRDSLGVPTTDEDGTVIITKYGEGYRLDEEGKKVVKAKKGAAGKTSKAASKVTSKAKGAASETAPDFGDMLKALYQRFDEERTSAGLDDIGELEQCKSAIVILCNRLEIRL